jgi:mannan endo-1,4-beta-mannosidase
MKKIFLSLFFIFLIIFIGIFSFIKVRKPFILGVAVEGTEFSYLKLNLLEKDMGVKPGIVLFYLPWPFITEQNSSILVKRSLNIIWQSGLLPCLTWEPFNVLAEDVLRGNWDVYLENFIKEIKAYNNPVILRFAHEMNLDHYHWGVKKNNFNSKTPELYKELFRYIVKFFQKNQVNNVLFAFSPNAESIPDIAWNDMINYYPGDAFVDIIGLDGYNFGTSMQA